MHIDFYEFGKIRIDNNFYSSDVIIFPDVVTDHWWRQQGHNLTVEDLNEVLQYRPQVLVIGTGYFGRMNIPEETKQHIEQQGISLVALPTSDAVNELNRLQAQCVNAVGAFHLTC